MYFDNPKPQKQLSYALDNAIPLMVWIGEDEVKQGKAKIKVMDTTKEESVNRSELLAKVKECLK